MSRLKQSFSNALSSATSKLSGGGGGGGSSRAGISSAAGRDADTGTDPSASSSLYGKKRGTGQLGAPFRSMSGGIGNVQSSSVDSEVSWKDSGLHSAVMFFTFLGICCFAAVAAFQAKWKIGVSGLSGFALFASLFTFLISAVMFGIPFAYDKWDALRGPAIFLKVPRTILILESTGALWAVILALATIISAFTEPGCKAPANDPHASLGDKYQSELAGWCRTKRAGSIFFWLAFAAWGGLLGFTLFKLIKTRRSRPRDEPFAVPGSATEADFSASFSPPRTQAGAGAGTGYARPGQDNEDDVDAARSPFADRYADGGGGGRASIDPYGAFAGDVPDGYGQPGGRGMSRTMHLATYGGATPDPFSNIRQSLVSPPPQLPPLHYGPTPTPLPPPQPMFSPPPAGQPLFSPPPPPPMSTPSPHPYPGAYPTHAQAQSYAYPQTQAFQPTPAPPQLPNQQPPFTDPYADPHQPPYATQTGGGLPQPPHYAQPAPGGWQ